MTSLKLLKGATYDIAHHAQSGPSFLYPHLGEACSEAGINFIKIELLATDPYPNELKRIKPLEHAIKSLKTRFNNILSKMNIPLSEVNELNLVFKFPEEFDDYSIYSVESTLIGKSGKKIYSDCLKKPNKAIKTDRNRRRYGQVQLSWQVSR